MIQHTAGKKCGWVETAACVKAQDVITVLRQERRQYGGKAAQQKAN